MVHLKPDRELLFSPSARQKTTAGVILFDRDLMELSRRVPHSRRTLVVMAKAPKPGLVKTRLLEALPATAVTALYRCLLDDTLSLAKSLPDVQVVVMCPEPDRNDLTQILGNTVEVVAQKGSGLASGLTSVFRQFTAGGQPVIAFNSDSPHLPATVLDSAFQIIETNDVVVGPTHDGGYYLVGAKAFYPSLFESNGMGTSSALERLLSRIKQLDLSTGFTEPFYDIDVATDLAQLALELQLAPAKAPRTANWFREWSQAIAKFGEPPSEM